MIDVICYLWVDVAKWIVRERCKVHYRVESLQVIRGHVAQIHTESRQIRTRISEVAPDEDADVKAHYLVASFPEKRC